MEQRDVETGYEKELVSVPHLTSGAETIVCLEPSNGNLK